MGGVSRPRVRKLARQPFREISIISLNGVSSLTRFLDGA